MLRRMCWIVGTTMTLVGCAASDDGGYYPPYAYSGTADAGAPPSAVDTDPRFEDVGVNPFTLASYDPFSTFAADVDTASYDIFTRAVEDGTLPPAASVRLEEYVNAFDYTYDAPALDDEVPFAVDIAMSPHPMGRDRTLMRVAIQTANPPGVVKLPSNLVFLVDVSGSMQSSDKLPLVQQLMRGALDQLDSGDTVSIVTYASSVGVRLRATPVSERQAIERAINGLSASGSTAGAAGIDLAYQQAEGAFQAEGFNHVIMMTDGDFNVGPYSNDELVSLIEEKRRTGVTLTALGFGYGNLNDAMMERVSNAGNGVYSVITSAEHADRYAREDLLRSSTFVAQDLKIQVELNPAFVQAYRLLGYENRALDDNLFRDDVVDAGEVGAGHQVTALYELVHVGDELPAPAGAPPIAGLGASGPADMTLERTIDAAAWVQVRLRWKDVGASETTPAYEALFTADDTQALGEPDADLEWAAAMAALAELLKQSPYAEPEDIGRVHAIVSRLAGQDDERTRFLARWPLARARLESASALP